jgi:Domain of unknown function (DUF4278)
MKLLYRGLSYEYNPGTIVGRPDSEQPAIGNPYTLSYRGASYTVYPGLESSVAAPQPVGRLVYRGHAYSLNGDQPSVVPQVRKVDRMTPVAQTHRSNVYLNIQRRLQAAQAQGDQTLVSLLERELQQVA